MSFFSSDRERRLWVWTLVVMIAIGSTLGLARSLAGVVSDPRLVGVLFAVGVLLVAATIVTHGLRVRPSGVEITVALGVVVACLFVLVRMATPAERTHLIEYGVVAVFVHEALVERARQGRPVPTPALLATLMTAALGAIDEGIQAFVPSRVFDLRDLLFNVLAAVLAVTAGVGMRRRYPRPSMNSRI